MWLSRAGVWLICISFVMPSAAVPAYGPEAPQELPKTVAARGVQKWSGYRGACTSLDEVVAYYYNVSGERIRASLSEVLQANAGKTVVVTYNVRDYTCEIVGLREPDAIGNPSATIRKTLRGAVDLRSDDSETVKPGEAITTDNPMSRLTWEITLEAGKERTGTYRYTVWVRV